MNPVQMFYENPFFADLKETAPFLEYLAAEEEKVYEGMNGGKALDVGCGSGRSTIILSKTVDSVIGIEFSQRLFEDAQRNTKNIRNARVYLEDAKSMHFEDDEFDAVALLWNTFGNLYSFRTRVLNEAKRVLKPDGKIYMSTFSEDVVESYIEMVRSNRMNVEHVDENYVFLREGMVSERFSKDKLYKIFDDAGLKLDIERLTDITYWCELRK